MSDRHHTQLSLDERIQIQKGIENGRSFNAIASEIGKDRSTVSREVRRNRKRIIGASRQESRPCIHMLRRDCSISFMRQALHEGGMQGVPINLQPIMPRIQPRSLRPAPEAAVCMQCLQAPRRMPEGQVLL